ncbi:hypothetical protein [Microbacterium sp. C7(2022)]|uniref:hypothetical protein n=1 Tax=Microbacterium sp. C7(2022) TaxID=2992759 RepID=UPI00237C01F1|nr:hypothetical protein [Microbacterium sp. C7(2022)]MDE0546391.1 hypothetical protein [Microbacterium sp. C7(2022)]
MSSDSSRRAGTPSTRRGRARQRQGRAFVRAFAIVVGALAVLGLVGAAANVTQGPRITDVQLDPEAAVAASGSRLIVTTSQSLAEVDPSQVSVNPAAPFAVDTSGRSVGVRFALPLWDDTEYTITIDGLTAFGGGPATRVSESFTTPAIDVHLMRRDANGDTIFRTDLSGENAVAVFTDPHIEDFRATATHLVISTRTDDDRARVLMTDLDGQNPVELPLPGDGFVTNLQSADRGELIGYTFSDASLSEDSGRESMLFTASLKNPDAAPVPITVEGADPRIADWRFVPDTDSILLLSFDGTLLLGSSEGLGATEGSDGGDGTNLGTAVGIEGIARGSTVAIVERVDQRTTIDLTDASEAPLVDADAGLPLVTSVTPLPDGTTLRAGAVLEGDTPTGRTAVDYVDVDGATTPLFELPSTDALLQVCASPSARYAALMIAPDVVNNSYDTYQLPLPSVVETRIVSIADGAEVVAMTGSAISWCQTPPM